MKLCKHDWKRIIKKEKVKVWWALVFTSEYREYYVCSKCERRLE